MQIHTVLKKQSKADVVCSPEWQAPAPLPPVLASPAAQTSRPEANDNNSSPAAAAAAGLLAGALRPCVLFVDDSAAEHFDPRLAQHRGVVRVLFARAR